MPAERAERSFSGVIRVGCSGWQYRDWRGGLYPAGLPQKQWLEAYAGAFDTVEVDGTFYRLPAEETFAAWRARVPAGFLFALKASRFLTHLKRLREPAAPLALFWRRARLLGENLGPVLYQLPPNLKRDDARLADFLAALPEGRQAVEFRHPSWYAEATFRALARAGVALCVHDMPGSEPPREPVGPFLYLRLHGAAGPYAGGYPDAALANWARLLARQRVPAFVYFNNDTAGHAPVDALRLRRLLGQRAAVGVEGEAGYQGTSG